MSEAKIEFVNSPSVEAVQGAWWVIAQSLSRKTGVEITPVFGDEAQKVIDKRNAQNIKTSNVS